MNERVIKGSRKKCKHEGKEAIREKKGTGEEKWRLGKRGEREGEGGRISKTKRGRERARCSVHIRQHASLLPPPLFSSQSTHGVMGGERTQKGGGGREKQRKRARDQQGRVVSMMSKHTPHSCGGAKVLSRKTYLLEVAFRERVCV
jgi:hypothetical protein